MFLKAMSDQLKNIGLSLLSITRDFMTLINIARHGLLTVTIAVPRSLKSIHYSFPDLGPRKGEGGIVVPRAGEGQREVEGWEESVDPSKS